MHVTFDPSKLTFEAYQVGGAFSYYNGGDPYQRGYGTLVIRQRGAGLGSIFKGLIRYLMPIIRSSGQAIGKEGLSTAARVLGNVSQGSNLREAVITAAAQGANNLINTAANSGSERMKDLVENVKSEMMQKGSGRKRKAFYLNQYIGKSVPKKLVKRRVRQDSLGFY